MTAQADWVRDSAFNAGGSGANGAVLAMLRQPDGRLLIAGNFATYNGISRVRIARLNADGSLDASFDPGTGASGSVYAVTVQPDGRILIGGAFNSVNDTPRVRIARLNANGSLDASFDPGAGLGSTVHALALQPDGRILVGGQFTTPQQRVTRLNANGSVDAGFNPGAGANAIVRAVVLQGDGRVLIGGDFSQVDGQWHRGVARLNADGSRDAGFTTGGSGTGPQGPIYGVAPDAGVRVVIAGVYSSFSGAPAGNIVRIVPDGLFADRFQPSQ